jgi:hypothetical protein
MDQHPLNDSFVEVCLILVRVELPGRSFERCPELGRPQGANSWLLEGDLKSPARVLEVEWHMPEPDGVSDDGFGEPRRCLQFDFSGEREPLHLVARDGGNRSATISSSAQSHPLLRCRTAPFVRNTAASRTIRGRCASIWHHQCGRSLPMDRRSLDGLSVLTTNHDA